MGCASSNQGDSKDKSNTNGNAKAGAKAGGGEGGEAAEPAPPKQNPYVSLTHKDIYFLKMSWKGIKRSMEDTGIAMFMKMFEANEDLKKYFDKFKNLNSEQLLKSTALLNHATAVMESIDTTVTELDDAEKTHQRLKRLGVEHKARGVADSAIKEIRDPFLKSVEQTLGDRYSDRMRSIYEIFIDYLLKAMLEGYNS